VITVHGPHHVKVPVSDLTRGRAWHETVLTLSPHLEFPDDIPTPARDCLAGLLVRCGTRWLASLSCGDASRGRAQPPSRW
jgi:hypothetical protein